MADTADADNPPEDHLCWAADFATRTVRGAWSLQVRLGESPDEQVRESLIALVTERSPRAKVQMIKDRVELLTPAADRLLDRIVGLLRALPQADASHVRFFESHRDMIRLVRTGEVVPDDVPAEALPRAEVDRIVADIDTAGPSSASDYDDHGRMLRNRGNIEDARTAFIEAIRLARLNGEPAVEGRAELGLFTLVTRTSHSKPGSHGQMVGHARRAADAYRRAADAIGERDAVVAMITALVDIRDKPALELALRRLARLSRDYEQWWRTYAAAMHSTDLEQRVSGLRWCIDFAHLLDGHVDFYRNMCAHKLAFYENREIISDADGPDTIQAAMLASEVRTMGPTKAAADQLETILSSVEEMRHHARSQAVQRELSETYNVAYRTATICAEELRDPEAALDINELSSSRALLTQAGMHQLWRQWHPQVWEDSRSKSLQRKLRRFTLEPTEQNRRLLIRGFAERREVQQHHEYKLLSATPGLTTAPSPVPTRLVRETLAADDRVVVYSATGSIFLITRDGCRAIGRLPEREVAAVVPEALARLSDPLGSPTTDSNAIAWLTDNVVQPVLQHTPEGCRLFIVPHGPLWRIPLGALAPILLSRTRELSYVPNLTILARLLTRTRLVRNIERFVGLGDPDGSLPHARTEIEHAANTFIDSFTAVGERLHYHLVMANLADSDVAHLGCHGMVFPDYPDFSALHIAGDGENTEYLWYGELARYEFNARLIVLAACHSGTGDVLFGSEYIGFPGAFLAAGAQSVLAPLWAVSDASTKALMNHFYSYFDHATSPATALRKAQQAMAADPSTENPYHWAGFQLFGVAQSQLYPETS